MKAIIVLAFFGILGYTFCNGSVQHVRTGPDHCRDVYQQAAENFDSGRFFTGSWYLTYAKHKNYTGECVEFQATNDPFVLKYQVNGKKVNCQGSNVTNARHVEFDCKGEDGDTSPYTTYQSVMSVIATDYNSYGTLYTCLKTGNKGENVFVLSRSKTDQPSEAAKTSVKKLGDTFGDYTKFNCQGS